MNVSVPPAVQRFLTADVAQEIAKTFADSPVYPERIVVDTPASPSRSFPGWPGAVLILSYENQGVCSWGVPLDGGSHQVLVGGDLLDTGHTTVTYTASVEDYIAARRWDNQCLRPPMLMAQAVELDQASLGYLQARLALQSRRLAGQARGSTGSNIGMCGSCSGLVPVTATGGYLPQTNGLSRISPPGCSTCPTSARRCTPTTTPVLRSSAN